MFNKRTLTDASMLWNMGIALALLVYGVGLLIPLMDSDAALYAEVSMEMHQRGDYLQLFFKGSDWLDKPHFPFWITALSFKIFGMNGFAYKIPGVLFVLLGAWYTWLFGKRFYGRLQALFAVFLLLTSEHIIISNQDVRAEPYMTGLTIMALYHVASYLGTKRFRDLALTSLALGCLMMTKGLFTVIPVATGVFFALVYEWKWKQLFNWQWVGLVLLTLLALAPGLYAYFIQFDMHPEKVMFGKTGTSGVKFFLWDSQWGRFRNTGPIKGSGDPFFFVHTMLWAFLPWAFLAFFALYRKTRDMVRRQVNTETYTYFGFIVLFLIFSASKFQLSYYLNPLFPLLAILVAEQLVALSRNRTFLKTFSIIHLVQVILVIVVMIALQYFFFRDLPGWLSLFVMALFMAWAAWIFIRKGMYMKKILFATAFVTLAVNFYLNQWFYPHLLRYQSQSTMVEWLRDNHVPMDDLICFDADELISDFTLQRPLKKYTLEQGSVELLKGKLAYTTPEGLDKIQALGLKAEVLKEFEEFHVTMLTGTFINKDTRPQALKKRYLVRILP